MLLVVVVVVVGEGRGRVGWGATNSTHKSEVPGNGTNTRTTENG
jgi:ribosomal protein S5